jgi:acetoin utilization deacetylase AcuC-like enzyme
VSGLYFSHPSSLAHETGPHPENAGRIRAIEATMERAGWPGLQRVLAPEASREQLLRAHSPEHIDRIVEIGSDGGGVLDLETVMSPGSLEAALTAAGGACAAVDALLAGDAPFAVAALRPPGHHCERDTPMGFCLFNNAAVAAEQALAAGVERVLVLDWDVHHGNGTEEIFKASDSVLYSSIHQSPLYPGTGAADYTGEGAGEGFTVNLPVPPGSGPERFLALVQHVVAPIAREFRPGLIIVSAGYDAHRADPLASCLLDEQAYAEMSASVRDLAAELEVGVLVCLEGGYDVTALADSVLASVEALQGSGAPRIAELEAAEPHRARLASRWKL